jgi:4'-phosphopantetheinyl transferase
MSEQSRRSDCSPAQKACLWPMPSALPTLEGGQVHVWCAGLEMDGEQQHKLQASLSSDELKQAEGFRFDRHREWFIVRRAVLRKLVAHYLGETPARIAFGYGPNGKPYVLKPGTARLHFNLSHSNAVALYAFATDGEVGIDVEEIRQLPDASAIALRYFSSDENAALRRVNAPQRLEAFFNCWTRKEAYVKATGEGLMRPLDSFCVDVTNIELGGLIPVDPRGGNVQWWLRSLIPALGFVGAVAAAGQEWALEAWRWGADLP